MQDYIVIINELVDRVHKIGRTEPIPAISPKVLARQAAEEARKVSMGLEAQMHLVRRHGALCACIK